MNSLRMLMCRSIRYFLLWSLVFFTVSNSVAQLLVRKDGSNNNPQHLVENVLLGKGVQVMNVTFQGDTGNQFGYFRDFSKSIIGLDSGLVLSTGNVVNIMPDSSANNFLPVNIQDTNLLNIANKVPTVLNLPFTVLNMHDAAIIEFDFVPLADTVEFRFVFGSEEYPDYSTIPPTGGFINLQFNDVFGFFISGPGITGVYSSPPQFPGGAQNIAFVPGSSPPLPITVSSVHNGDNTIAPLNSQYFVPGDTANVAFNGFTVPLTAKLSVTACDTFHLKMAIADGADRALNSGVFLEARSFSSVNLKVDIRPQLYSFSSDSSIYEDCGTINLVFRRFSDISSKRRVDFSISGTAQNGIDYSQLPDSIVFQPGQATTSLNFNVFNDGLAEGTETLIIGVKQDTIDCVVQDTSTAIFEIKDPSSVTLSNPTIQVGCLEDTMLVANPALQGVQPIRYLWSTGDTTDTLIFSPPVDSVLQVTATDACMSDTAVGLVTLIASTPILQTAASDDTVFCSDDTVSIGPQVLSGSSQQQFQWSTGDTSQFIRVSTANDSTFIVTTTDACDSLNPQTDTITVFSLTPMINLISKDDTLDCTEPTTQIGPIVQNGSGSEHYQWSTGDTNRLIKVQNVMKDSSYIVTVTDDCNLANTVVDTITVYSQSPPLSINTSDTGLSCNTNPITLDVEVLTGSGKQLFNWSTGDTTEQLQVNPAVTTTYFVTVTDFCDASQVVQDSIQVKILTSPLTIQAQDLNAVCDTGATDMEVDVLSGNPPFQFQWSNGAGSRVFQATIHSDTGFTVTVTDSCGVSATDTLDVHFALPSPIVSQTTDTTINCPGDSVGLAVTASGGVAPYEFTWSTGAGGSNIGAKPETTTQYVVQVRDQCPATLHFDTTAVVVKSAQPMASALADTSIACAGASLLLSQPITGGTPPYTYQWQKDGAMLATTDSAVTVELSGGELITMIVTDLCERSFYDTARITLLPPPGLNCNLPNDTSICEGDVVMIRGNGSGGQPPYGYTWYYNNREIDENDSAIAFQEAFTTTVKAVLRDQCNSTAVDQVLVRVQSCDLLNIPNIFTPNGDGLNDFFEVPGTDLTGEGSALPTAEVIIMNRWGETVFQASPYQNNWDGHGYSEGVYYYVINLSDGRTFKGTVSLIR